MQKMSNGDYFDEKMRRGDRSKEARRISPPLKLLLKSPKLRGSTAPKSAHLHRGREQGGGGRFSSCVNLFAVIAGALPGVVTKSCDSQSSYKI